MKLATISTNGRFKQSRFGIIIQNKDFLDINYLWELQFNKLGFYSPEKRAAHKAPNSLSKILEIHEAPLNFLLESLDLYHKFKKDGDLQTKNHNSIISPINSDMNYLAPIDHINCYRDFFAHEAHVKTGFAKRGEEIPAAWYEIPVYYKGSTAGFIGPEQEIIWPSYTDKLDYELELGLVMAKDGKNIKAEKSMHYALGFTILNDISARDIQKLEMAARLGPAKGKDFCSVIGPVITTIDEFNYQTPNLNMTASVNGELWSKGQSGDAHWSFEEMIEHASKDEWVLATDFIGSGTVGTGCGLEIEKWIQSGDTLELTIDKIGTLRNKVGKKEKSNEK